MAEHAAAVGNTLDMLLETKKYSTLKDILVTMNPSDIAAVFEDLDQDRVPLLFRLLPKELAAETFAEMESDLQELLIKGFSDTELREVVDELYVDDAADLVEDMPANVVKRILAQADPQMRKEINEILRYPDNSAGSIMTTEYVSLRPAMTVGEAITRLRRTGVDKETIYTCYVTENRKLVGFVTLKDLLMNPDDDQKIVEMMDENVIHVHTTDDREEVSQILSKYNYIAVPVVDDEDRMVGIITFDDVLDVIEEEATEDIEKGAAILPSEKSYMKSSVFDIFKQRIPWLMLLMISATFTEMIITSHEKSISAQVVLASFIPMLTGTGGNCGSQATVTVVRALSLGDVEFGDIFKVIWKEVRTALLCGLALSVVCFAKLMLLDKMVLGNSEITISIALVVCAAMAVTTLLAKVLGCTLPLIIDKCGFDPAVMSSPFITTIVDVLSLIVYFGIVSVVLF